MSDEPAGAEEIRAAIAAELRAARARRGVTMDDLAARSGLSKSSIVRFEHGERTPTVVHLVILARALDADPAAIVSAATVASESPAL